METYNNNFLTQERKTLETTLHQVAIKIRDKIQESGKRCLLTEAQAHHLKKDGTPILDTLWGYVYDDDIVVYEREVKGFIVTEKGALLVCVDLSTVLYDEEALLQTFEYCDETWHLVLDEQNNLVSSDTCAIYLTLLSVSECIYQYFEK